jgi:hypothetical protein
VSETCDILSSAQLQTVSPYKKFDIFLMSSAAHKVSTRFPINVKSSELKLRLIVQTL